MNTKAPFFLLILLCCTAKSMEPSTQSQTLAEVIAAEPQLEATLQDFVPIMAIVGGAALVAVLVGDTPDERVGNRRDEESDDDCTIL